MPGKGQRRRDDETTDNQPPTNIQTNKQTIKDEEVRERQTQGDTHVWMVTAYPYPLLVLSWGATPHSSSQQTHIHITSHL